MPSLLLEGAKSSVEDTSTSTVKTPMEESMEDSVMTGAVSPLEEGPPASTTTTPTQTSVPPSSTTTDGAPFPPPTSATMSLVSSGSSITSSVVSNEPEPAADSGGNTSGADLILPLIICEFPLLPLQRVKTFIDVCRCSSFVLFTAVAVVKSNPPKLVSHLLYIQRYRASMCFTGESSYALVNVTAVVEFLENVDPRTLGLGDSDKVLR